MKNNITQKLIPAIQVNPFHYLLFVLLLLIMISCKRLIDVDPPVTSLTGASVYNSDATAISAVTYIYTSLSSKSTYTNGFTNLSLYAGLSADELTLFDLSNTQLLVYYRNALSINTGGYEYWTYLYPYIYTCNFSIEGLTKAINLTPAIKQQLLGESKFMRAYFYFYLVNLYGDVPLAVSSDYKINSQLARSPKAQVYQQIITDLKDAQKLLSTDYLDGTLLKVSKERIRPNKWAATALLSRTYLYIGDWANAETQATSLINNSSLYTLSDLDSVFLKNNTEAIWQLQPVTANITNTQDAYEFIIPATGPSNTWPVYLSNNLLNIFEINDQRKTNWIGKYTDTTVTPHINYYYPFKYKINTPNVPVTEYLMMLRLGEQYLIRAEARAQQNDIIDAQNDINTIRARAGLTNTMANDKTSILTSIIHERQAELFTELGQRWLDLKRTNNVDVIMDSVCNQKGGSWNLNSQWYPINFSDIQKDPNLIQNPGY